MPTLRRAGRPGRGRPRRGDPAGPAAGQRRRQHDDPRLRPRPLPHRPGADRGRRARPAARARPGRLPLQPRHGRADDGTMVDFAGGHPSTEDAAEVIARPRRRARAADGIEFHPGVQYRHIVVAPGDWADAECVAAPRPDRQAGRAGPTGPAAGRADRAHGRVAAAIVGPLRPRRQPGLALGPGLPAAAAVVPRAPRRRRPAWSPRSTSCGASACSPAWTSSRSRAPPAGTTPTTRASATPRSTALADGPTCSSSTSRPPTRPATPATSRRRCRRSSTGTAASSPAWSPGSTRWARGGCCSCPTTPRRVRAQDPHHRPGALPARRLARSTARRRLHRGRRPRPPRPSPGHELIGRLSRSPSHGPRLSSASGWRSATASSRLTDGPPDRSLPTQSWSLSEPGRLRRTRRRLPLVHADRRPDPPVSPNTAVRLDDHRNRGVQP